MKKEIAETCNCSGLFAKISLFLLLILTMFFPVHAEITKKIIFVDDDYYSRYAGDTATAERYFLAQGFTPMTAPEILEFMKNGKAPGSVILSLTDVNPKMWVEPYDKTCALYQYCSRGGRFVNPAGSTLLSFIGKDDLFTKADDAHYPKKSFLYQTFGVNFAYGLRGKDRVLTDTGKAWGLNRDWPRWGNYLDIAVYADSVTPFVVAKKGTAALIWLKNINKEYPNSGLIGACFNLRNFLPMFEAIYRVCLFDGKPIVNVPKVNYKKRAEAVKDYKLQVEHNKIPRSVFERGETIPLKVISRKNTPFKVIAVDSTGTIFNNLNTALWKEGEYTLRCIVNGKTVDEKKIFIAEKRKVQDYPIFIWKHTRRHLKREGVAAEYIANRHLNTVIDDIHEMTGSGLDRLANVIDNTLKYHQSFTARTSIIRMFTDKKEDQLVLYTGKVHSHGVNHLSLSSRAAAADFKVFADRQSQQIKQILDSYAPNFYKYTTVNDDGSMLGNFDFHPKTVADFEAKTGIKRSQLPEFIKQKHGYHVYLPVVKPGIIPWDHPFLQYFRYHTSNYNKIAAETTKASHGILVGDIGLMAGPLYPGRGFYPPLSHTNYPTVTFYNYTFWYSAISHNIEFAKTAGREKPWGAVVSAHYTPWGEAFQRGILFRLIANAPQFIGLWHLDQGAMNKPEVENTWKGTQEITAQLAKAGNFYKLQKPVQRKAALLYDIAQICFQIDQKNAYPYARYSALENFRRAGGSADIISSEEVIAGALQKYDMIILHDCQWMTDKVRDLLIDYIKKGGKVIGDKSVKIDIPGMEKIPNSFGAGLGHIGAAYCTMNFNQPIKKYLQQEAVTSMGINGIVYNNEMPDKTPIAWVLDCETNTEARECQAAMTKNWNQGAYKYLTATAAKTGLREHKLKIRDNVVVYDLFNQREVPVVNGIATVKLRLLDAVPLLLLKDRIQKLNVSVKDTVVPRGKTAAINLSLEGSGNKLINGMVPAQVKVKKDGKELWAYGSNIILKDGKGSYSITVPENESAGTWEITATELASGKTAKTTIAIK